MNTTTNDLVWGLSVAAKKLTAAGKVGMSRYCLSLLDKLSDLEPHAGDKEEARELLARVGG